jgi:hypothetical protein
MPDQIEGKLMSRAPLVKPENNDDPLIKEMFAWVTEVEGDVPNHIPLL